MEIIDVHCHLQGLSNQSLDSLIEKAKNNRVKYFISAATNLNDWRENSLLTQYNPSLKHALGIHPWFIREDDLTELSHYTDSNFTACTAIGEVGLDTKNCSTPLHEQTIIFEYFLKLAKELKLPLIIHCVGAYNQLILSVKRIGLPDSGAILHAYHGSLELTKQLIKLGFKFSTGRFINSNYSSKSRKIKELLNYIYPEYLLLESDYFPSNSPEYSPNSPVELKITQYLRSTALLLETTEEKVRSSTTKLANSIFNL